MIKNIINKILYRINLRLGKCFPRPSTEFMKEHFKNKKVAGTEIGVYAGENAKSILKNLNVKKLYLIDPYDLTDESKFYEMFNVKGICHRRFRDTKNIKFVEEFSNIAVNQIPLLDFVYIDGDHSFESVTSDMINYWKKIKKGGVMGGHDFTAMNLGVIRAVSNFCVEHGLQLYVKNIDWWVVK